MKKYNFKFFRGDDVPFLLTCKDADGAAIDITGYKFFITLKSDNSTADADADAKAEVSTHLDAAGGITQLILPHSQTDSLVGDYYYDFQQVDTNGYITTFMYGIITVLEDTTRRTAV